MIDLHAAGADHRRWSARRPARRLGTASSWVLDRYQLIRIPADVYQVSYVPFTSCRSTSPSSWSRRVAHLLPRDDLSRRARPRGSIRCRRCDTNERASGRAAVSWPSVDAFIEVAASNKSYRVGAQDIRRAARSRSDGRARARWWRSSARRGVGKSTLLHVLGGLDRADRARVTIDGARPRRAGRCRRCVAFRNRAGRLRLPVPPPAAGVQRARERRDADADRAACRRPRRGPRAEALLRARRPGRAARPPARRCCRAASSSAWRWRARWSCSRRCCWPTSRPATSTSTPADSLHALLREMHREHGLTSVIATHNPRLAAACDRVLRLEGGRLVRRP